MRPRLRALAALALLLAAIAPVRGADPADDGEIERGIRQVHEGELQAGIATLEAALQRPAGTARPRDVALAHVWIGIAHLGLDRLNQARDSMRAAVEADPTLALEPDEFPTQVVLLFQDATAGHRAPAPAVTPAVPPAPAKKGHGKALLIGGAVAASAAGVAVATGGGGSPPPTPRPSPTAVTCTDPALSALPVFAFPPNGSTVRGVVSVSCQIPADFPTSCVAFVAYSVLPSCGRTFTLIGQPTAPPYGVVWDSATVPNGLQCLECGLWDTQGRPGPVQHVTVTIAN